MRINEEIRAREVRVIANGGEQLGIMSSRDALKLALENHLDLVEIAPTAKPPVCRIMDYGKYRYEQQKREKEARKKQKTFDIKEVKLRPGIEDHDFNVKYKNAVRFLEDGDKVKVTIMFRGRELSHRAWRGAAESYGTAVERNCRRRKSSKIRRQKHDYDCCAETC